MKSDKDVLQQKVQNLQEQLAELRLQQTECKEPKATSKQMLVAWEKRSPSWK